MLGRFGGSGDVEQPAKAMPRPPSRISRRVGGPAVLQQRLGHVWADSVSPGGFGEVAGGMNNRCQRQFSIRKRRCDSGVGGSRSARACETLACIRKLRLPSMQINIADKQLNQDFHFGPGTATVYTRAASNTASFRAEPCTSLPPVAASASSHRSQMLIDRYEEFRDHEQDYGMHLVCIPRLRQRQCETVTVR